MRGKPLIFLLGLIGAGWGVRPAPAAVWFVATNGSDTTGTGAIGAPFHTINYALGRAVSGDVVELRGGVYRESGEVRFRNPGVTLRSHPGEWAWIAAPLDNEADFSSCILIDPDADHTTLARLEISGGYYYGVMLQTKWDWGGPNRAGACLVMIEDCVIHDTGRDCVKITPNCDDITIRRCEIYRSGVGPANIAADNAEGIDCVNGDRVWVRDCLIHDIYSSGVYLKGGAMDGGVERTRVHRCGAGGVLLGFDTSPEYFDTTTNPRYYENIRGTVRNCLITDTGWEGIGLYAASNPAVFNNTLINVCASNIHAALYFGLSFQDWEPHPGRPPSVKPVILNNLIAQPAGFRDEIFEIRYSADLGGLSALEGWPMMDHNGYFIAGGGAPRFTDHRPGLELEQGTLAQWRAHAGADLNSQTTDPLFADAAAMHGRLQAGSPYVNQGANAGWMAGATDLDGNARIWQNTVEVGACEYGVPDMSLPVSLSGQTVCVYLYDNTAAQWLEFPDGGEQTAPTQIVVSNVKPNQYYWLGIWSYAGANWAHGHWFARIDTRPSGRFVGHVLTIAGASSVGLPADGVDIAASAGHTIWPVTLDLVAWEWNYSLPQVCSSGTYTCQAASWSPWIWLVFYDLTTGRWF